MDLARARRRALPLACLGGLVQPPDAARLDAWCTSAPIPTPAWVARLRNPLPATPERVAQGRALYFGKGFCAVCHGRDGTGFGADVDTSRLRGALPRDLSDDTWQRARSDGELYWTLVAGRPGTAMASFVPAVLSEEEAWQVLLHVRALGSGSVRSEDSR